MSFSRIMSAATPKRINIWMPMLFSGVLILGMVFGFLLNKSSTLKKGITSIIQNDRLEEIISLINNRYVDAVDEEEIYREGINGILSKLDPHTFYIPSENVNKTNDNLKGNYKGIGLEYNILNDTLVIVSIVKNGPAYSAGLSLGDKIIAINDVEVSRGGITMDEVRNVLRSSTSDTVLLSVLPYAAKEISGFALVRENIHVSSIDLAYLIQPKIGYVRINKFTEDTYKEFRQALDGLDPYALEGLVLDLRQNTGGYIETAIQVLDELFEEKRLLLTINGKTFSKEQYTSTGGGAFEEGRLVVLIDETTASSSEIVAGAVQDWDRGVVIGRPSFGKGLVQEQFDLSDGSALRLTIARYYTPTGRSIQRDYSKGREWYDKESEARIAEYAPEPVTENGDARYYTLRNRRQVNGGVGIVPDVYIAYREYMQKANMWHVANGLENFVNNYFSSHLKDFMKYHTFEDFNRNFQIDARILQAFRSEINMVFADNANSVWKNAQKIDYLKILMKAHFARLMYRNEGFFRVMNEKNDMVLKAVDVLKTSQYNKLLHNN